MDNLLKDVREAERLGYGIHYGRYKVDHPHTANISVDLDPEPVKRKCKECGAAFDPGASNQLYCCEECKNAAGSRRSYEKRKAMDLQVGMATCAFCGMEFYRKRKTQTCCSRSCSASNRNPYRRKKLLGG